MGIRVLIFGAAGMLGHKLMQLWSPRYDVIGTVRKPAVNYRCYGMLDQGHLIDNVDVNNFIAIEKIVSSVRPDFIVNCVGIIKQLDIANDAISAININSLFPHRLAKLCLRYGARMIHISTDCVFSGRNGMYKESDFPDPPDLYGRTKLLGEVNCAKCLTIRTSFIGRELNSRNGLLEWFLQSDEKIVNGFSAVIYTGFTTIELARVIGMVMESDAELTGIYHVSAERITKYDLLTLVRDQLGVDKKIISVDQPVIDRSLDSTRFRKDMGYEPPSWGEMIRELAIDNYNYSGRRQRFSF